MSSADSKPPSDTRSRCYLYCCSEGARRLMLEMSTLHVFSSAACIDVSIAIGLVVFVVPCNIEAGTDDVAWTDDRAISPDAMQRARDVKNLPTLKIVDMTFVFPSR